MDDLIQLLMRRDGISKNEAIRCITDCKEEIMDIIQNDGTLSEVEDAIAYHLSLEPDYLDYFLM